MPLEIERKFLVIGDGWKQTAEGVFFCQGYLNRDKERTVRVRIAGEKAFLTIKGLSRGMARPEFEYEIPLDHAGEMLKICDGPLIEKIRYSLNHKGCIWEIDEFLGENNGLVIAEIELESEEQDFVIPDWVGAEVTDDARYFNSNLAFSPFARWDKT